MVPICLLFRDSTVQPKYMYSAKWWIRPFQDSCNSLHCFIQQLVPVTVKHEYFADRIIREIYYVADLCHLWSSC